MTRSKKEQLLARLSTVVEPISMLEAEGLEIEDIVRITGLERDVPFVEGYGFVKPGDPRATGMYRDGYRFAL